MQDSGADQEKAIDVDDAGCQAAECERVVVAPAPDHHGECVVAAPAPDPNGVSCAGDGPPAQPQPTEMAGRSVEESAMEQAMHDDAMLEWWRKCSGLHTVEKWVKNYRKHPAGWGALLMIQGCPEVTGRLRSKVENYAIYSALFLSASIPAIIDPPNSLAGNGAYGMPLVDEIRKRCFFYCLATGIASHMLCIMLSMAFVNALNEAARDSDVYRLLARGKGFLATRKCQRAFTAGALLDFMAIASAASAYVGWEAVFFTAILGSVVAKVFLDTANPLFASASIVNYWREDLGGNPDADDPYDLQVPVDRFSRRAEQSKMVDEVVKADAVSSDCTEEFGAGGRAPPRIEVTDLRHVNVQKWQRHVEHFGRPIGGRLVAGGL